MKKLLNILKKCALVLAIGLVISNITVPTPEEFHPEPEVSICAPTPNPDEAPFGDTAYN